MKSEIVTNLAGAIMDAWNDGDIKATSDIEKIIRKETLSTRAKEKLVEKYKRQQEEIATLEKQIKELNLSK